MQYESMGREIAPNIAQIQDIKAGDTGLLKQAEQIYSLSLGQNYISADDLMRYAANPEKYILLGATIDRKLAGIMLAFPLNEEIGREFNEAFQKNNVSIFLPQYSTGVIKSVAVHPDFRHHGLGTKLTIEAMARLKRMSTKIFAALSWDSGKPDSSPKMFEKLGYKNVLTVKEYWKQDSEEKQYACPNCGNPCHCTAIFYIKKA